MTLLRLLLLTIATVVIVYTLPVIAEHGLLPLLPTFFGDMTEMNWPGQFNLDFFGFLLLSATWTAWRNEFTAQAWLLALGALFLGAPYLSLYLVYLSVRTNGDIAAMLLGEGRAAALRRST